MVSAILDTVGALVVVLDPEGRIIRFNRAGEQSTGYSSAEVAGQRIWDLLMVPEEVGRFKAIFEQLCRDQMPNDYEGYLVRRDGERRLIAWSPNPSMSSTCSRIERPTTTFWSAGPRRWPNRCETSGSRHLRAAAKSPIQSRTSPRAPLASAE